MSTTHKPAASHPWRNYPNKKKKSDQTKEYEESEKRNVRPLREFLMDLAENWSTYTVPVEGKLETKKLSRMPESKSALWIAGFIKKHYASQEIEVSIV